MDVPPTFTQENLLFSVLTPLGDNKLLFKSLQGQERLSKLFSFHLELLSQSTQLAFDKLDKLVGQPVTVKVQYAPDYTRYFHGHLTRFVQAGRDARFTVYQATIRPWLWFLTRTKNCRIFQHQSVPDIIRTVFNELGFRDYQFRLIYPYEPRTYCVQYEETTFNFVSRLLEDEGIFYFFEHTEERHTLILADDLSAHPPCPGFSRVRFWEPTLHRLAPPEDTITACQFSQQVITSQYAVDDFNFERPQSNLQTDLDGRRSRWRVYEYAAGFGQRAQGETKVRRRLEACLAKQQWLTGEGHCFSLVSGHQFKLVDHLCEAFNRSYVLHQVSHSLSLTYYENTFRALSCHRVLPPARDDAQATDCQYPNGHCDGSAGGRDLDRSVWSD